MAFYRLDVPRLTVMIGEDCNRCSPEAMVGEMRFYTSSLAHLNFIMLSSVVVPSGALQYQIFSTAGLNFALSLSLGL